MRTRCTASLLLVLSIAGCALPPFRTEAEFPRQVVLTRLKCELYNAAFLAYQMQLGTINPVTGKDIRDRFPFEKYTASLTLKEFSQQNAGAFLGGGIQSDSDTTRTVRRLNVGAGSFPLIASASQNSHSNEAKRTFPLAEIVDDFNSENGFGKSCSAARVAGLPVGKDLGMFQKLRQTIDETAKTPGGIGKDEYVFTFNVVVGAGGTISFAEPLRNLSIGGGASQTYTETVTVTIAPIGQ